MAVALPDPMSTRLTVKRALELAPDLDIVARASQPKDIELLYQLGAKEVVQSEFEASLELSAHLLASMGIAQPLIQSQVQMIRNSRYLSFLSGNRTLASVSRELKAAASELNNTWYALSEDSPLLGLTLEETDLRRLTGVSVIAIRRVGGLEVDYPTPEETLESGDRVLLIGDSAEIEAFGALARGEAAVPSKENSCQWVALPEDSPAVSQPIVDLNLPLKYRVEIQAIRREGRFIRLPEATTRLQDGDLLLICGRLEALRTAAAWLANQENPQTTIAVLG